MTVAKTWETVRDAKQAERDARIPSAWRLKELPKGTNVMDVPRTCGILTPREIEITETCAVDLVKAMVDKKYTAEEVTTAFCKRAAIAQQLTNCLTEIFFDEGIAQARAIDEEYAKTGQPRGILHGLPISLKDNIAITGYDSSTGFVNECGKPATEDADNVVSLRRAGAVFFCKTNVPTAMLMADTYNNVWGHTSNPWNTEYGAGGSSGGEGALLALRGSPLGIGSDIGGSIRIPAAICGIYGLKPAYGRFSSHGARSGQPGQETIKAVNGPMSPDFSSLELFTRAILQDKQWERDPWTWPIPFREEELPAKLCFGIISDDGVTRPTPCVKRVIEEQARALLAAGHEVLEYVPYDVATGRATTWALLLGDGGFLMRKQVVDAPIPEPWPKDLEMFEDRYQALKDAPPTITQLWEKQLNRTAYMRKFMEDWDATRKRTGTGRPIDCVIGAVYPAPASPKLDFVIGANYTMLWNVADFCGTTYPAGFSRIDDKVEQQPSFRNGEEERLWKQYDTKRLEGMPIGLQLLLPRHHEEKTLKLTGVAIDALNAQRKKEKTSQL